MLKIFEQVFDLDRSNKNNSPSHSLQWHGLSSFLLLVSLIYTEKLYKGMHIPNCIINAQFPHFDAKVV